MSKVYSLKAIQRIPVDLETAWNFFSKPENLNAITPKKMGFKILGVTNSYEKKMYEGQLIEYIVKPLFGIPLYWLTEITHIKNKKYFIDEQRFGPYSLWHHQHHFKKISNGIEMTDIVHYKIPFWFIGDVANEFIVRKQLREIFKYRYRMIQKKFGRWENYRGSIQFK